MLLLQRLEDIQEEREGKNTAAIVEEVEEEEGFFLAPASYNSLALAIALAVIIEFAYAL